MNDRDMGEDGGGRGWKGAQVKVYVGNLPSGITADKVKEFMVQFGNVENCSLINRNSDKPFAFIGYSNEESVLAAIEANGIRLGDRFLTINRHYPAAQAKDGSKEFQRTLYVGNVPFGMEPPDLKKVLLDAIKPIKVDFRTHQRDNTQRRRGLNSIQTATNSEQKSSDVSIIAFLVFQNMEEANKGGNILYDLELEGNKLIVEYSKGRNRLQYQANQVRVLHVSNLAYSVDAEQITKKFRLFGEIDEVRLIKDRSTGKSKGYGFVEFRNPACAEHAVHVLGGMTWQGREMVVQLEANEKRRLVGQQMGRQRMKRPRFDPRMNQRVSNFTPREVNQRGPNFNPHEVNKRGPNLPPLEKFVPRPPRMRGPRADIFNLSVEPAMPIPSGAPAFDIANTSIEGHGGGGEITLFVSNLPNAPDHKVRFLLEQLTGPMINFKKEGPDGWLKYENMECARIAYDILREHRIEGIRLVVEILSDKNQTAGQRPRAPLSQGEATFKGHSGAGTWSQNLKIEGSSRGGGDGIMWDGRKNSTEVSNAPNFNRPRSADSEGLQLKLFVGNLSFDVNKFVLHRLFSKHGQIDQIILPKKDGGPAGFAFIFFNSHEEAINAVRSMNGFNLGGRRLRVELSTSKGPQDDRSGPNKRHFGRDARGMGAAYNPGAFNGNTPFSDPAIFSNPSQRTQAYGQR